MTTIPQITKDCRTAMEKSFEASRRELASIRTGKATASLLDTVRVDAYGQQMPLNQVAGVSAPEPRLLTVTPWDKGLVTAIEKALRESDLGLNPQTQSGVIRVPLPSLNEQRRKELVKVVHKLAEEAPFAIKTTEAPSYRRVALNHMREAGRTAAEIERTPVYRGFGIRDGHGIMFVSNQGDIYPAGFLPLVTGNVRVNKLVDVYRDSPIFQSLHNPSTFRGKCGVCEYRTLCGGSRARAFAYSGDPLGSDPFCAYEPRNAAASQSATDAAQKILAGTY